MLVVGQLLVNFSAGRLKSENVLPNIMQNIDMIWMKIFVWIYWHLKCLIVIKLQLWVCYHHTYVLGSIVLGEKVVEFNVKHTWLALNISCLITYGPLLLFPFISILFILKSQPDKLWISYITVLIGFCVDEWICQLLPCL